LKSSSKSTNVGDPCLARLGRKTVENKILKDAVDFFQNKKVDSALACIARGQA
jgi:hypothetical protein